MAADLETGERVVLERGDLTSAMRASMSAPGVFAPVEVDGRLLVDGGIVENLPVDVVKAMGVDIVIAVDVGFRPVARKELTSALAVSNQAVTIMMMRETGRQRSLLAGNDLLITPDLEELQSTDFTATARLIGLGLAATRANAERLARLSLDDDVVAAYTPPRAPVRQGRGGGAFRAHRQAPERYSERIQAELGPVLGQPLDPEEMDERLSHFYGSDNFEALDYRLVRDGALTGIEVSARQKSWGPNFLRFGLELQNDFQGGNSFNAGVRAQVTEVNRFGAEWQTDLQVGANPLFRTGVLPADRVHLELVRRAARSWSSGRTSTSSRAIAALRRYRIDNRELEFDFGREFGSWGELRAGIIRGNGNRHLQVGDPEDPSLPPRTEFERGEFMTRFSVDLLDDAYFPRHGDLFTLQWNGPRESLGADTNADRVSLDWTHAHSWNRNTLILSAAGGAHVSGPTDQVQDYYSLGGLFNLLGAVAGPDQRAAVRDHARNRVPAHRQRPGRPVSTCRPTSAFRSSSATSGIRRGDASVSSALFNGSAFVGFDTFLGPIYVAAGFGEGGDRTFYLLLGRIR